MQGFRKDPTGSYTEFFPNACSAEIMAGIPVAMTLRAEVIYRSRRARRDDSGYWDITEQSDHPWGVYST